MDEEWIDLAEFIRCLLHFTATLYRAQPGAKYGVMSFEEKLDLVLKWCHKMDAQTGSPQKSSRPTMRHFRSNSLSMSKMRRKKSLPLGSLSADPVITVQAPARSLTNVTSISSSNHHHSPRNSIVSEEVEDK